MPCSKTLKTRINTGFLFASCEALTVRSRPYGGKTSTRIGCTFAGGYVRNRLDVPKTPESLAPIPLVDRVRVPLELWRQKCGYPTEGWLFPSEGTLPGDRITAPEMKHLAGGPSPLDLHNLISRVIAPTVRIAGLKWKPLKAGRTGACTEVIERSNGNAALAQALLRHKNMTTTTAVYKKQISPAALLSGMLGLEK